MALKIHIEYGNKIRWIAKYTPHYTKEYRQAKICINITSTSISLFSFCWFTVLIAIYEQELSSTKIKTSMGEVEPVGFVRLKVMQLFQALAESHYQCVDQFLIDNDVFSLSFVRVLMHFIIGFALISFLFNRICFSGSIGTVIYTEL